MKKLTLCKIYNDGSHYIAIPYKRNPDEKVEDILGYEKIDPNEIGKRVNIADFIEISEEEQKLNQAKVIFETNYRKVIDLTKKQRLDFYYELLKDFFPNRKTCDRFVQNNFNRKFRNFVYRKLRMLRKVNLLKFDYFCTFTYDDSKLSEVDFRKKLLYFLQHKATRDDWKYIGVFERSPEKKRLHFHCLLSAEESTIPGIFTKKRVWSSKVKKMKAVFENSHIKERFGVNDFSRINYNDAEEYSDCVNYLLKYIEKSGERIIYSRGLYQFLISLLDAENDVLTRKYKHCVKLIMYDDFNVYNDNGAVLGVCSKETLNQLKRTNE